MRERLLGALLVVTYAFTMVLAPKNFYISLVYLLGIGMVAELFTMSRMESAKTSAVVIFSILYFAGIHIPHVSFLIPSAGILFLFGYFILVEGKVPESFLITAGFFIYLTVGVISIGKLSKEFFILLLSIVWSVDTFAYLVGKYFGRHKLNPEISPKKTVEGAIGGSLGGVITGSLIGNHLGVIDFSLTTLFILASLAVISQIGDLLESFIKRAFGFKDSGNLIPGHGGLLDRLDSSLAVAPFLVIIGGLQ